MHTSKERSTISSQLRRLLSCFLLTGCTSHKPAVPEAPVPSSSRAEAIRNVKESGISPFRIYEPGILRYRIDLRSVIRPTIGDSLHPVDSAQTRAVAIVNFSQTTQHNTVTASIHFDSSFVQSSNNVSVPLPSEILSFTIDKETGQVISQDSQPSQCTDSTTTRNTFLGTEVLPAISPQQKQSWTDSSQTKLCRTGIMLTLKRSTNYTITHQDSADIEIVRATDLTLSGNGSQWNQPVTVAGLGTAIDTILLVRSRLTRVTGTSQLQLNFHSAIRNQQYAQTVMTKIELQP